ncbi:hypothetical protein MMC26_005154 [Xylographa opegraphella]|nr:hypothetical protein [Xylographa opegraphella]
MGPWQRYTLTSLLLAVLLLFTIRNVDLFRGKRRGSLSTWSPLVTTSTKAVVIGKLQAEDTSWVSRDLPEWVAHLSRQRARTRTPIADPRPLPSWQHAAYTVDNTSAALHTPANKGREALAYLTYVVEHYDSLPDTVLFLHAHRDGEFRAWHVDNEAHDNVEAVRALRLEYVAEAGYVNLRCGHLPGCNHEVQPFRSPPVDGLEVEHAMHEAWASMFPDVPLPREIGSPCCAQFAVSKRQIRARPRADYERYRDWVLETRLPDRTSGRVMEYLWHIIFGKGAVQ